MTASLFWDRVKVLVQAKNKTQESLCNDLKISLGTYRNWVYYERFPPTDLGYLIAKALNTTIEELLEDENLIENVKKKELLAEKLAYNLKNMPEGFLSVFDSAVGAYLQDEKNFK